MSAFFISASPKKVKVKRQIASHQGEKCPFWVSKKLKVQK